MNKPKVIVICGPTASGKTTLSIQLAQKINGEIISSDSMQIYKDMNIGTAKPDQQEMQGIKHYLLDFVEPNQRYSVADYKKDAENAIEDILQKGKVPIIVGGTGLYVDSLIYGIEYPNIEFDENYRKELERRVEKEGLEKLYETISKMFSLNEINLDNEIVITNLRHKNLISKALINVKKSEEAIEQNMPVDIIAIFIKDILEDLGNITGDVVTDDIINEIFSKFCLGK